MVDLVGWRTTTATGVVSSLPLQTFDGALLLADSYLASVGGWVPDNPQDSTGEGLPENGAAPEQAVAEIRATQLLRTQTLDASVNVDLSLQFITNLSPGQDQETVIAQIQPLVKSLLIDQFQNLPFSLTSVNTITGDVSEGGTVTDSERVSINTTIAQGTTRGDPRAIAVAAARSTYTLSDLYNADVVFTEAKQPIVVIVRAYTNTNYTTIDEAITDQYVIGVNPNTLTIESGVRVPVTQTT